MAVPLLVDFEALRCLAAGKSNRNFKHIDSFFVGQLAALLCQMERFKKEKEKEKDQLRDAGMDANVSMEEDKLTLEQVIPICLSLQCYLECEVGSWPVAAIVEDNHFLK